MIKSSYLKTSKYFDFEIDTHPAYPLKQGGFSSSYTTLRGAYKWAEQLLHYNKTATVVNFKSINGWKIYTVKR